MPSICSGTGHRVLGPEDPLLLLRQRHGREKTVLRRKAETERSPPLPTPSRWPHTSTLWALISDQGVLGTQRLFTRTL